MTDRKEKPKFDYTAQDVAILGRLSAPDPYVIQTVVKLRPITGKVAVEPDDANDFGRQTMRMRYDVLTTDLPLAGDPALRRTLSSELLVIKTLRGGASWLENVIAVVERQLELQPALGRPWIQIAPFLLVGAVKV